MSVTSAPTIHTESATNARACTTTKRLGHTLLELLVALPIAALLGTLAIAQFLNINTLARRLNTSLAISRELRQAGEILTSELRPLSAADLITWSDSAIEFHALIGSGVLCTAPAANTLDLLPLNGTDALRTTWFATPQPGDNVWTIPNDTTLMPAPDTWNMSSLQATAASATSPCNTEPLLTLGSNNTAPAQRITLAANIAHTPQTGSLIRITRHVRYSLYRASDNLWYLGRKSLDTSGWTTIQPVAGPLLSPGNAGLIVQVRDSTAAVIPFGNAHKPVSVTLTMHAASQWMTSAPHTPPTYGVTDSLHLTIALRGALRVSP